MSANKCANNQDQLVCHLQRDSKTELMTAQSTQGGETHVMVFQEVINV